MTEKQQVYVKTAPRSLAPPEGSVNTASAYDEIFHRLGRFPNLTDDQRDAFALTLDVVLVDQISDSELAGIVSGDLPNYPLRPGGGQSLGLPGAQATSRYVGATVSGAPTTGTFRLGDFVIAQDGHVWICTVAGSPGTWVDEALADVIINTPDATSTVKGLVKLAGDLGGTAASPTVPGLAAKVNAAGAAAAAPVQSVASKTGAVSLAKADVGLGNVDNTSDANKPVSTAQAALNGTFVAPLIIISGTGIDRTGTTDSAAAIQTKLTAAAGGLAYLPEGTYRCDSQLKIPSGTELVGAGWKAVLSFTWTTTSGGSYYLGNSDMTNGNVNIRVRDLQIQGAGDGTPFGAPSPGPTTGILFRRGSGYEVRNCRFYRVPGVSLGYQGVQRIRIAENTVYQGGRDGITGWWYTDPLSDVVVANNTIHTVGDDGIAVNASTAGNPNTSVRPQRVSITGNTIYGQASYSASGAGRGIVLLGVQDATISGNTISDTFSSGIGITADAVVSSSLFRCRNIAITGNQIRRAGQQGDSTQPRKGIRVTGSDNCTITGNSVTDSYDDGIYVNDAVGGTVAGNTVDHCGTILTSSVAQFGIHLDGVSATSNVVGVAVTGNTISFCAGGGIRNNYAKNSPIVGNTCFNNGASDVGQYANGGGIVLTGDQFYIASNNHCFDTRAATLAGTTAVTLTTVAGQNAVVGTGTSFTAASVGLPIFVPGAGVSGADYLGIITGWTDATHITVGQTNALTTAPGTSVTTAAAKFGYKTQTFGIVLPSVGGAPTVMLVGNILLTNSGVGFSQQQVSATAIIKRANIESGTSASNLNFDQDQSGVKHFSLAGTPEGTTTAPVGSTARRTDGGTGTTFYVKESGTGNTGWVAK